MSLLPPPHAYLFAYMDWRRDFENGWEDLPTSGGQLNLGEKYENEKPVEIDGALPYLEMRWTPPAKNRRTGHSFYFAYARRRDQRLFGQASQNTGGGNHLWRHMCWATPGDWNKRIMPHLYGCGVCGITHFCGAGLGKEWRWRAWIRSAECTYDACEMRCLKFFQPDPCTVKINGENSLVCVYSGHVVETQAFFADSSGFNDYEEQRMREYYTEGEEGAAQAFSAHAAGSATLAHATNALKRAQQVSGDMAIRRSLCETAASARATKRAHVSHSQFLRALMEGNRLDRIYDEAVGNAVSDEEDDAHDDEESSSAAQTSESDEDEEEKNKKKKKADGFRQVDARLTSTTAPSLLPSDVATVQNGWRPKRPRMETAPYYLADAIGEDVMTGHHASKNIKYMDRRPWPMRDTHFHARIMFSRWRLVDLIPNIEELFPKRSAHGVRPAPTPTVAATERESGGGGDMNIEDILLDALNAGDEAEEEEDPARKEDREEHARTGSSPPAVVWMTPRGKPIPAANKPQKRLYSDLQQDDVLTIAAPSSTAPPLIRRRQRTPLQFAHERMLCVRRELFKVLNHLPLMTSLCLYQGWCDQLADHLVTFLKRAQIQLDETLISFYLSLLRRWSELLFMTLPSVANEKLRPEIMIVAYFGYLGYQTTFFNDAMDRPWRILPSSPAHMTLPHYKWEQYCFEDRHAQKCLRQGKIPRKKNEARRKTKFEKLPFAADVNTKCTLLQAVTLSTALMDVLKRYATQSPTWVWHWFRGYGLKPM